MPNPTITQLASRLSRLEPGPPCRHAPGTDHATGELVQGDVRRGPGGLNDPTRARLAVEKQTEVKGRTGLVSGLPAPVREASTQQRALRAAAGSPSGEAAPAS